MAIFVTGASSGFGAAMCRTFIDAGYDVIGAARRLDKLQALKKELGECFLPLAMDVSDKDSVDKALCSLQGSWLDIELLINNAGLALGLSSVQNTDYADWETMIRTNILGLTYVTHKLLPGMVKKNSGYIMNIGSVAGSWPYFGGNVYGASKAFVRQFSLNLRADLAGTNIRISNIEPGLCGGTEFSNVRFKGDVQQAESVYKNVDYMRPEDIADTVFWLYKTPAHINVNSIEIMPVAQSFAGLKVSRN